MGLISTEVEVILNNKTIKYYEDLGYEIPRYKNKWEKSVVKRGTKITVKVEDLPKSSKVEVDVTCDCCRKDYRMKYQDYNRYNHDEKIYCNKCSNSVLCSKENHPNWNPNKTDEERGIQRNYPEYTEFIKKVLKRDNYTCRCCGKQNDDMEVHHLNGYDWCIEQRTDETNGVTLCKSCHKNFHSIYGKGRNTREQFYEWYGQAIELVKYNGELPTARKIYCYEENKVYDSVKRLAKEWKVKNNSHIYDCCNKKKRNNKYVKSIKGKHLVWLDKWESWTYEQKEEWKKWAFGSKTGKKKIVCLETGVIYESIADAGNRTGIRHISDCCIGRYKTAGGYTWMYHEDYLKQYNIDDLDKVS